MERNTGDQGTRKENGSGACEWFSSGAGAVPYGVTQLALIIDTGDEEALLFASSPIVVGLVAATLGSPFWTAGQLLRATTRRKGRWPLREQTPGLPSTGLPQLLHLARERGLWVRVILL